MHDRVIFYGRLLLGVISSLSLHCMPLWGCGVRNGAHILSAMRRR